MNVTQSTIKPSAQGTVGMDSSHLTQTKELLD